MKAGIPGFRGLAKRTAPQRLEPGQAVDALNCRIESGDLVPFKAPLAVLDTGSTATGTHTLCKYTAAAGRTWVRWDAAVNPVRSPVIEDTYYRLYWTDGVYPKQTDKNIIGGTDGSAPAASRRVGVLAPIAGPYASPGQFKVQQPVIPGLGTISSITFAVQANVANSSAAVTTVDNHGLSNNETVTFVYPGIDVEKVFAVKKTGDKTFQCRDLKLRQFKIVNFRRDKEGAHPVYTEGDLQVRAPGHGLQSGDKIVLAASAGETWASTSLSTTTVYTVHVINTNRFYLVDTDIGWGAWGAGVKHVSTPATGVKLGVAISTVEHPYQLSGGDPSVSWDGTTYTIISNGTYGDGTVAYTVTSTNLAPKLRQVYYVSTFINGYGQEGPPSIPFGATWDGASAVSTPLTIVPGESAVTIQWDSGTLNGARGSGVWATHADLVDANQWNTYKIKFYRTDDLGEFRFVPDATLLSTGSFSDSKANTLLAEALPTRGYIDPPDGLLGLAQALNGVVVGYYGKTVMASVPYQPHAWPLAYRVVAANNIVGLVPTSAGIIVITDGYPEILVGTDPATWQLVKLEIPQACLSARSIVDMGEWGMYASPDGLVAIQQNDAKVATAELFNRAQWASFSDSTMLGAFYEGAYFGSYGSGGSRKGFLFDPATGNFVRVEPGYAPVALYLDVPTDTLYFLASDGKIYAFDRGATYLGVTWESGIFQAPCPWNPAAGQVIADVGAGAALTAYVYGDTTLRHTQSVTGEAPFRLPGNYRSRDFVIKLISTGDVRVKLAAVAGSVDELKEV